MPLFRTHLGSRPGLCPFRAGVRWERREVHAVAMVAERLVSGTTATFLWLITVASSTDVLQRALGQASQGEDVTAQLMTALSTTIQHQTTTAAALRQQIQQLEAMVATSGPSRAPMFVDVKNLGRLEKFKGGKKNCRTGRSFSELSSEASIGRLLNLAVGG